ncbi:MAG: hypothetical protein Q9169_005105 [Polycauliona sp. 2 TL-2023]
MALPPRQGAMTAFPWKTDSNVVFVKSAHQATDNTAEYAVRMLQPSGDKYPQAVMLTRVYKVLNDKTKPSSELVDEEDQGQEYEELKDKSVLLTVDQPRQTELLVKSSML